MVCAFSRFAGAGTVLITGFANTGLLFIKGLGLKQTLLS
jgi:hypothetical protein